MKANPAVDIMQAFREVQKDHDELKALIGADIERIGALQEEINMLIAKVTQKIRDRNEAR